MNVGSPIADLLVAVREQSGPRGTIAPKNGAFSIYRSYREQRLLNVPLVKPLLMAVLSGTKSYGDQPPIAAEAGSFLLVSESHNTPMRNIPGSAEYLALLVEFAWSDFESLEHDPSVRHDGGHIHAPLSREVALSLE